MFFGLYGFGQKTISIKNDTTQMCIPYPVAQKILLDLNDYDRLKEVVITYKNEIYELNNKNVVMSKEIEAWKQQDTFNKEIISEKNETIKIYSSENDDLRKENKRLKTKNGLISIISAVIIAPLTYISAFK